MGLELANIMTSLAISRVSNDCRVLFLGIYIGFL